MRAHHIPHDGLILCLHHAEQFRKGEDCPDCVGEDVSKRAATYCETHDETFETICPRCSIWRANTLDSDNQGQPSKHDDTVPKLAAENERIKRIFKEYQATNARRLAELTAIVEAMRVAYENDFKATT